MVIGSEPLLGRLWGDGPDDRSYVSVNGHGVSREELARRASSTAALITGAGAVAVHGAASMDTVVAVAAALHAGVAVVPLAADVGITERDHVLRDSGLAAALGPWPWADTGLEVIPVAGSHPAGRSTAGRSAAATRGARPKARSGGGPGGQDPLAAGADTALVMYTSGTTGPPKGVVLSHRALAADLDALAEAWSWTPEDHLVHGLPLFHVHGLVLGVIGALRVGSRLTHTGRPTAAAYAAAGGSLYFGVPTVWSRICAEPDSARALRPARLLVSGSAALGSGTFAELIELTGHAPVERYGTTETLITLSARADRGRRAGRVGWPLSGVLTRVRDDAGRVVGRDASGVVGELEVSGPTLFDGYVGVERNEATGWTADGWFRTGDAVFVDDDGTWGIVGRLATDLIKTGGYRVGAGEIEEALLGHPAVAEAAVVGQDDADLGQRIVAFVVADGTDAAALEAWVAQRLSRHKRPREIRFVSELPRNAMGKVQKTRLS